MASFDKEVITLQWNEEQMKVIKHLDTNIDVLIGRIAGLVLRLDRLEPKCGPVDGEFTEDGEIEETTFRPQDGDIEICNTSTSGPVVQQAV